MQIVIAGIIEDTLQQRIERFRPVLDDVVDDSNYRRGFFSLNALWKNKIAVLVGDYLLSKGLLLSIENKDFICRKCLYFMRYINRLAHTYIPADFSQYLPACPAASVY